jgi:integrase
MKRARIPNRLSALAVQRAKEPGMYPDGLGLYLQVSQAGTKSWIFRYKMPGANTSREMGLGSLHNFTLQEARGRALDARKLKADGIDPIEHKRAQRAAVAAEQAKAVTFQDAAERYIEAHSAGWKNEKHRQQWPSTMKAYVYPVIGALPVQTIDAGLVMKILEPIWSDKTETATRVRGRIERILDWATARGYRSGENPARWRGHLQSLLAAPAKIAKVEHHPALAYSEIGAFMVELGLQTGDAADALTLLVLTATRTSEVIGASWPEVDFGAKVWTIPADRIKAGREHRIPLSGPALALLKRRHEGRTDDGWIFPGVRQKHLSNNAILALLGRMDRDNLTAHGFRSTFRDWAAEQTNFPREVAEMALAHAIGDKVEAAYRRGDLFTKRTRLMDSWAAYALAAPRQGQLVSMRREAVQS